MVGGTAELVMAILAMIAATVALSGSIIGMALILFSDDDKGFPILVIAGVAAILTIVIANIAKALWYGG